MYEATLQKAHLCDLICLVGATQIVQHMNFNASQLAKAVQKQSIKQFLACRHVDKLKMSGKQKKRQTEWHYRLKDLIKGKAEWKFQSFWKAMMDVLAASDWYHYLEIANVSAK